jgi:branched-chain amino acid transport system substrate-binding protein
MRMSLIRATLVVLAVGLCLPGCAGPSQPLPVLLGHVATLSGPDRDVGEAAVRGIRLAVMEEDKSPGQGAGRKVKVIHTDTLGKLDAFEAEAVRLVTVNRVSALLGGATPEEVERLELARVPVVSPCGVRPRSRNDAVFCTGLAPARQGQVLARFAAERFPGQQVVALANESRDDSVALAEAFVRALQAASTKKDAKPFTGRPVVLRYGKDIKLAELARRLSKENGTLVLIAGTVADARELRGKVNGKDLVLLFGGADGSAKHFKEAYGHGAVYVATAFVADADTPKVQEFVKKYREQFSEDPDVHAALAYDNTRLLFKAVQEAQDNLTGAQLRDNLAGLKDFPGLTGPLTFDEGRQLRRAAFVVRVENGQARTEKRYGAE